MTKTPHELTPVEWRDFVDQLKAQAPAHAHWAQTINGTVGTWSTPTGLWSIEFDLPTKRSVIRQQGTENKWTNFMADADWHLQLLEHFGAIE